MKINRLILIISFLTFSLYSYADLKVSNNTGETLVVAIGYIENNQHVSIGWFAIKQGETQVVVATNTLKRKYYYYAVDARKREYQGDEKFTVSSDIQFNIHQNNTSSQTEAPKKGFKMVDLMSDNLKEYTIQIPELVTYSTIKPPVIAVPKSVIKAPKGTHQTRETQNQKLSN